MPKKKPDPAPTQPSVPNPESSSLSFTIETFDDPETGQPTHYGRFSRHWQDEEALDVLIDKLEAGQLSHKQALMQARKLEATTPYNLEIQNFIANLHLQPCAACDCMALSSHSARSQSSAVSMSCTRWRGSGTGASVSLSICVVPFVSEQAEAHHVVVLPAIEVLVTQNAFALETQVQMEADGALVEG